MRGGKHKTGLTLVEIMTVVAIVAILVSMVIGVVTRIDSQAKEQLTEGTIAIVTAALEQFADYEYQYSTNSTYDTLGFGFPVDCNLQPDLQIALADALGASSVTIVPIDNHLDEYSESEALYFFLNRVPQSRQILNKIDNSLITNRDDYGYEMKISVDIGDVVRDYPLLRIIDPWGRTLRYSYYDRFMDVFRTFPVITSAGPDGFFNTLDDISNRD